MIDVWAVETRVPEIPVRSVRAKVASVWSQTSSVVAGVADAGIMSGMKTASTLRVISTTGPCSSVQFTQSVTIILIRDRKNHSYFVVRVESFSRQAFKQRKALQYVIVVHNRLAADRTQFIIVSRTDADREDKNTTEFEILRNRDRVSSVRKAVGDENQNFFAGFSLCDFEDFLKINGACNVGWKLFGYKNFTFAFNKAL